MESSGKHFYDIYKQYRSNHHGKPSLMILNSVFMTSLPLDRPDLVGPVGFFDGIRMQEDRSAGAERIRFEPRLNISASSDDELMDSAIVIGQGPEGLYLTNETAQRLEGVLRIAAHVLENCHPVHPDEAAEANRLALLIRQHIL